MARLFGQTKTAACCEKVREAQAMCGALLWLSTRTRPELTFADGQMTIGVKAALAGSVLSNLPSTLPQGATQIPEILQGIDSLTFQ